MYTFDEIEKTDSEIADAIKAEMERQNSHIELIASENWVSKAVMAAMGSPLTNKYAEGYPGKRYYGGCQCVDVVENLARDRAKELFGCEYANVQPHSGAQANLAVFFAMLEPGDKVMGMNLDHGGHLTHGSPVNISGKYFNIVFYDVNEGVISVDGYPIRNLTRDSLRKAFTMVLQDTWLFQGTIEENVAYAREDATLEEVIAVCKKAHIHDFVETLPQGYQTVLTDDGVNISKGQKQLLTIARAMLSNARMLILDEATSNVDSRTEMAIQDAMLELMKGRTCFVIAHRLSTIKNADVILVLKDGDIIESGTHDELLQARGFYAKLFNSQFES